MPPVSVRVWVSVSFSLVLRFCALKLITSNECIAQGAPSFELVRRRKYRERAVVTAFIIIIPWSHCDSGYQPVSQLVTNHKAHTVKSSLHWLSCDIIWKSAACQTVPHIAHSSLKPTNSIHHMVTKVQSQLVT